MRDLYLVLSLQRRGEGSGPRGGPEAWRVPA